MLFQDRRDAGRQLAGRLLHLKNPASPPVVLGLPRGGVIVAAEVARELEAPLDVLVVRKIGAPEQKELALGAVTDGEEPRFVLNQELIDSLGVSKVYLNAEIASEFMEVQRRQREYRQGLQAIPIKGRTVIVIDDGIATGATVRAGLISLRERGVARIVLAVPVAASESLAQLGRVADEIVCLSSPMNFMSVGRFYGNFDQTTDEEVVAALSRVNQPTDSAGSRDRN